MHISVTQHNVVLAPPPPLCVNHHLPDDMGTDSNHIIIMGKDAYTSLVTFCPDMSIQ